ncbi:muconate/chloromuconate family cycloisomerase [Saccharopolyspora sp. TS4A08]|uniref:Muconate/chloromuconate family cycloisomerase n=1 Tax=Saccharopolyspora ipomoeae TaxID=3042027 RepID=A0ABT6PQF2_9PSEU|nr:muconate/chloromuconate family cycloisomerase [Saccharopolyspora sp. TS4A08]MDI2030224.1 muconate/chloromuconate family cycloisomerase [Saccharopolyspora sp. TS4A08]
MTDMRIDGVETVIVDIPMRRAHRFARAGMSAQPVLYVFVRTSGGVTGVGEGVVPGGPWWGGESVETMQVIVEKYLAPVMLGRRVDEVPAILRDCADVVAANLFAKNAVDTALHDAWARHLDAPVHTLLGGALRSSVPVTWALGAETADVVADEALEKLDSGLHASFKLKMGALDPAADVARVVSVTEKLASVAGVRVDINARWDRLTSLTHLPALAEAGVEMVEQPVPGDDVDAMAAISAALPIPVMADESLRTPADALRLARTGAAGIFAVKTTKSGGLRACRAIGEVAAAAGIPCYAATSIESPIGTAASLQTACTNPATAWGSELFGPLLLAEEMLVEPLVYDTDGLHLPTGPGLGVELDPAKVRAFRRS